eukprot:COSAG06_NODE_4346_length_4350_cov_12.286756_3_plen_125_part_00
MKGKVVRSLAPRVGGHGALGRGARQFNATIHFGAKIAAAARDHSWGKLTGWHRASAHQPAPNHRARSARRQTHMVQTFTNGSSMLLPMSSKACEGSEGLARGSRAIGLPASRLSRDRGLENSEF